MKSTAEFKTELPAIATEGSLLNRIFSGTISLRAYDKSGLYCDLNTALKFLRLQCNHISKKKLIVDGIFYYSDSFLFDCI